MNFSYLTRCIWSATNVEPHSADNAEQRVALIVVPTGQLPADTVSAGVMERTDQLHVQCLRVTVTCQRGVDSIEWEDKINAPTIPNFSFSINTLFTNTKSADVFIYTVKSLRKCKAGI